MWNVSKVNYQFIVQYGSEFNKFVHEWQVLYSVVQVSQHLWYIKNCKVFSCKLGSGDQLIFKICLVIVAFQ